MARKPRDHKAAYARRIAKEEARLGRPLRKGERGAARGHKEAREYATRAAREHREAEAIGALTPTETRQVNKWIDGLSKRLSDAGEHTLSPDERADILAWATEAGYPATKAEMAFIRTIGHQGMSWDEIQVRVDNGEGVPVARVYRYRRADAMAGRRYTPRSTAQRNARRARERRIRRQAIQRRKIGTR